ncbi:hypothetical protein B0T10DRAFT_538112 [Thelonectria olida]|uniref:BZIP domain-containing protein n=1 Tax=Thelonectria olida TaxID=1576542 RepID=A0A9P8W482_9HYPO|nr:hypothetical protein B0T10DRAFT_538112 [Thelonectria olida]
MASSMPDSKQARKRELDRRAQRAARERNRNRIAFLEATVEAMKNRESSSGIAHLTDQLMEMTRQRDQLARTVSSIKEMIDLRHPDSASAVTANTTSTATANKTSEDQTPTPTILPQNNSGTSQDAIHVEDAIPAPSPPDASSMAMVPSSSALFHDDLNFNSIFQSSFPCSISDGPIIPAPDIVCDCLTAFVGNDVPAQSSQPPTSIWRTANELLGMQETPCKSSLQLEDEVFEDTPVRAILQGWDAVENGPGLSPIWKRLRQIDQLQFRDCGDTERLAILSTMHRMLRHRADPTEEQWAKLPAWLLSRPSQSLPHSSAIDFFVWPGVRERFVFSQHQYCSNFFWKVFVECFRISWPFEFRDCYKRNIMTGRYSVSPEFTDCIWDINSWTMTVDFFGHFPEMYSDIPSSIDPALVEGSMAMLTKSIERRPHPSQPVREARRTQPNSDAESQHATNDEAEA